MVCFPVFLFCPLPSPLLPTHLSPMQIQLPPGKNVLSDAAARPQKCILLSWPHSGKRRVPCSTASPHRGPPHFSLSSERGRGGGGERDHSTFGPNPITIEVKKKRFPSISMGPGSGPLIFIPRLTTYEEGQL